jgi:hypothetical protein
VTEGDRGVAGAERPASVEDHGGSIGLRVGYRGMTNPSSSAIP